MHKPGLNDIKLFLFVQVPAKNSTLLIMNKNESYFNKNSILEKTVGIKYKIPNRKVHVHLQGKHKCVAIVLLLWLFCTVVH